MPRAEIRSRKAPSRIATRQLSPRLLSAFFCQFFSLKPTESAQTLASDVAMHCIDFAQRTHHRAEAELAIPAVTDCDQLALVEKLPGAKAEQLGGKFIETTHCGERRRSFARDI